MRRFIVIFSILLTFIVAIGILDAQGPTPKRSYHGYVQVRPGGVTANDTALTVSTSHWTVCDGWVDIKEEWDTVSLSFYAYGDGVGAGDPHGAVFDANLYVAHEYGSAIHVCRFSGEIGNLQMSCDPAYGPGSEYNGGSASTDYKWAQGPFVLNESFWRSPIGVSGKEDGIGELNFNPSGATKIRVLFDNLADASTWYCVMTGRKR